MTGSSKAPLADDQGVMIDRAGTRDRDDAIWAQGAGDGWDLAVHIARVADVVPVGSAADQHAAQRVLTAYLPRDTVPMLPRAIEQAATLSADRECPTVRVSWHLAGDGTPSDVRVGEGRLRHAAAMDYAEATAAITDRAHPQHEALKAAHEAARVMLARRRHQGALAVYDLIRGWASDGDGGLRELAAVERHAAYIIIAELMVAANTLIAEYCAARDTLIPFRVHSPAAASSREQLTSDLDLAATGSGDWRQQAAWQRLGHLLHPAVYSVHAGEHYGLRLPWYCHATSPLRRHPDLLLQRQLLAALRGQEPPYGCDELTQAVEHANEVIRQRREQRGERHREAAWATRRAQLAAAQLGGLSAGDFHRLVKLAAREDRQRPELEAELLRRLTGGMLQPRDAYPVLLARGTEWEPSRAAVIAWLAAHPEHAVTLASTHAVNLGNGALVWDEAQVGTIRDPWFSARAGLPGGDGEGATWFPVRVMRSKGAARQQAALSLAAHLAGQPDPSASDAGAPEQGPAAPGAAAGAQNPVMALYELGQAGVIRDLAWTYQVTGPPHDRKFTCTAAARWGAASPPPGARDEPLTATGTAARSKKDAKASAAAALHEKIAATRPG